MSQGQEPISLIYDSRIRGATLKLLDNKNLIKTPENALKTTFYTFCNWSISEALHSEIKSECGKTIYPKLETAEEYFSREKKFYRLKFNSKSLDELLNEGIDVGSVTEFYGQSGSGKTQLCLQLALNCQLPIELGGLNGKVVYISTDKSFPIKRLVQMERGLKDNCDVAQKINFLDSIFIYELNTNQHLEAFLENEVYQLLSVNHWTLKLIIIDSIAGIYRTETNYIKRGKQMCKNFRNLQKLADKYNCSIVTTNHVTADPTKLYEMPAMGNTWSTIVTTRIHVEKSEEAHQLTINNQNELLKIRKMTVDYSPRLPTSNASFIVSSNGIESITEQGESRT